METENADTEKQGNLPKRLRFYGSMADQQMLEMGVVYSKLKDSYVIVICPFDYYGKGRHVYTFTNQCHEETGLEMADGTTKIVLNAVGTMDDVSGRLKECVDITKQYLNDASPGSGEIIKQEGYIDSLHINEISIAKSAVNSTFTTLFLKL